ncbi:MAG TPA: hypothetical protein VKB95_01025, partial [Chitinophagaceae bacterium]|nr:hypothetical protein [Chitinophagaceae bacterium]
MKSTFLIYPTALIIISCSSPNRAKEIDYDGFNERVIYLAEKDSNYTYKNRFATVFIKIPERLDTFYNWIDFSDYTGGQFMYYRFADKK